MGSPSAVEGGREAKGGGRGESGERSGVQAGSTLESTMPKVRSTSLEVVTITPRFSAVGVLQGS